MLIESDESNIKKINTTLQNSEIFSRSKLISAKSFKDGLEILHNEKIDLVFVDLNMPDAKGTNAIDVIKSASPATPIIVLCSENDMHNGLKGYLKGAENYFVLTKEARLSSFIYIMKSALNINSIQSLNSLMKTHQIFASLSNPSAPQTNSLH